MKKQLIVAGAGLIVVVLLFTFGRTTSNKKTSVAANKATETQKVFDIQEFILAEKAKLTPTQAIFLSKLENNITRGDVAAQGIKANIAIADFWKDSAKAFEPFVFYTSTAAKLDNSEKNLTFAAQLILNNLRNEQDEAKLNWETAEAIDLFERAIKINPNNDTLRVGLGSCYIFGKGRNGDPQETMKGIQELLGVVRKDSTNYQAQLVLGIGGLVSGQFEKAIERLNKVVTAEPNNKEAIAFLADAYAGKGDKVNAIKWYNVSKRLINDVHYTQEVDERIKSLK